jgi:hypothetical protein
MIAVVALIGLIAHVRVDFHRRLSQFCFEPL